MPTAKVNLDATQYVRVNIGQSPLVLQANRDEVKIIFADTQPAKSATAFHLLSGADPPFINEYNDTNVWALAMTDRSSLMVTEHVDYDAGGGVDPVGLKKADGTPINPSTEEKQDTGNTQLTNLNIRFGSATANPATYTLLYWAKTIWTALAGIYARQADGTQKTEVTNPFALETTAQSQLAVLNEIDGGEKELTTVAQLITASGNTTMHTPAAGKAIRLRKCYLVNDPSSGSPPVVTVSLGGTVKLVAYSISTRSVMTGGTDETLTVNLSTTGSVACTFWLEEVTL